MFQKIEFAFIICLIFGPIVLERFGIISGNWHSDLQETLLAVAAAGSLSAVWQLSNLAKEIERLKGKS